MSKQNKSKVSIKPLKGFRDFLPGDALKRKWLKDKIIAVFEKWGYDPIETPTLESLDIFEGQIGEEEKLFYKFKDYGNRDVALRYDQSVPTARFVGEYLAQLPMPFKRYQVQNVFRAEKPQRGRFREFTQCDADIFGVESPLADAEVIALSLDIYKSIGFKKAIVLINDRQLLMDFPYEAIVSIDKLKKVGEKGVIDEMVRKGISLKEAKNYLDTVKNLKPNKTVQTILDYLKQVGFPSDWYKFDPTIARSFSYSSGPIWEMEIPGYESGSVLGGERFDNLIESISGKKVVATGFGLGFDRTLEAAQMMRLIPDIETKTKVLVTIFGEDLLNDSLEVAGTLRGANIPTEVYTDALDKLPKQLKYADKKGIPFVVILGPDEASRQVVVVKNMETGMQKEVKLENLAGEF